MKLFVLIFCLLLAPVDNTRASLTCPEVGEMEVKMSQYLQKISRLLVKNEKVKAKTTSPSKKLKIISNLVILNNKKKVIEIKKSKLLKSYAHCFKGTENEK